MSLENHTLAVGGAVASLKDWGVKSAVMVHRLGGEDELRLTLAQEIDTTAMFAPFAEAVLRAPDGSVQFTGTVLNHQVQAAPGAERHAFTIVGPWYFLDRVIYRQQANFPLDLNDLTSRLTQEYISMVTLNRVLTSGATMTIAEQIDDALAYAVAAGAPITHSIANVPAARPAMDQQTDLRCSDVVRRQLLWCPHVGCRWEYAAGARHLVFESVTGGAWPARFVDVQGGELEGFSGSARYDNITPSLRINYISLNRQEIDGTPVTWREITVDESTTPNGAFGTMDMTIELAGAVYNGTDTTAAEEVPAGIAALLHHAFAEPAYDLDFTYIGAEVNWQYKVGERWNVLNGGTRFVAANGFAQEIVRDIGAGTTTLKCGPASQIGLGSLLDLIRASRLRRKPVTMGSDTYGFAEANDPDEKRKREMGDTDDLDVTYCGDGADKTRTFLVRPE